VRSNTKTESFSWTLSGLAKSNQTPTESLYRTLSGPARTLSGIQIPAQWLVPFELSIYSPSPPMARISLPDEIPVLKAHFLHFKCLLHLIIEHSLQVLDLEFEWRKDSSFLCDSPPQAHLGSWTFILHDYYSWSFSPRWLEVALELPLCVVSLGKFVLPI
jgi:hypothetical protein